MGCSRRLGLSVSDKPDPTPNPSSPETPGVRTSLAWKGAHSNRETEDIGNIFRRPLRFGNPRRTGGDKLKLSLLELFCLSWFQQELDKDVGRVGEARRKQGESQSRWYVEGCF